MIGVETTQAKHARRLAAEQRALLEQIARQAPLPEVLEGMCRVIEELSPDVIVSVLLADEEGRRLHHGAAPSLPAFYNQAIDGIATGEGIGSCGTAAHRRSKVIVTDIATDPLWDDFRELAGRAGLAACWSTPILGRDGRVLGTFAMYHRTPRAPWTPTSRWPACSSTPPPSPSSGTRRSWPGGRPTPGRRRPATTSPTC